MSLNKILLTPQLVAELYSNALVETHAGNSAVNTSLQHLGNNEKNILIVVAKMDSPVTEARLSFLTTILSACKLQLADVAIVDWKTMENNAKETIIQLESRAALLFDIDPITFGLPINFPQFQIQKFDKTTYLYAPSLKLVEQDLAIKKQLWNALKKMFTL